MYIVITGTSRGIGLELTKLALNDGHQVLAVARKPDESNELQNLKKRYSDKLEILQADLEDENVHTKITDAVSKWPMVDTVLNNAGIYKEDKTIEDFQKSFLINSIKPFFITRALKDKLSKSKRPVSLQITSLMGSIADNSGGGAYSYRASKTALNSIFKSYSIDESWLISLLVHPGWVQTDMGGSNAPTSVTESTQGIWKVMNEATSKQNGTYCDFRGKILPW